MANELWRGSLEDLAQAIRTRKVSSTEVVQAHLQRIDAVNPRVNALPEVLRDAALRAAARADHALARGVAPGPLHGVPFTLKINIDLVSYSSARLRRSHEQRVLGILCYRIRLCSEPGC